MAKLAFTAAEAAFVLREPVKTVKKALDIGPIRARLIGKAGLSVRTLDLSDLVYLMVERGMRDELTRKGREEFYVALKKAPVEQTLEVRFGRLSVAINDAKEEVRKRADELSRLVEKVEFRKDGEPLLKGTTIEVHRVAALLNGGMTVEEVCKDYPSLTPALVTTAKTYAETHPKAGRPYPATTVKRALRGAGLEALDEVFDEDQ